MADRDSGHWDELPILLRAAYLALHRRTDACLAGLGVTADQFVLLATLMRHGALTQNELARRMPSDPSTIRPMLHLLEQRGLIRRSSDAADARIRRVDLTVSGKRRFRQLWAAGDEIRATMRDSLRPDERESLVRSLACLAQALTGNPDASPLTQSGESR